MHAMDQTGKFTARPVMERSMDRKVMGLLAVLDSCKPMLCRTKKTTHRDPVIQSIARKSGRLQEKVAPVVVELCMQPNRCLPKDRYGTSLVSPALNADDHLTLSCLVMDPIRRFIAKLVMLRDLALRVMDMATRRPWCPYLENRLLLSVKQEQVKRHPREKVVEGVDSQYSLQSK